MKLGGFDTGEVEKNIKLAASSFIEVGAIVFRAFKPNGDNEVSGITSLAIGRQRAKFLIRGF